MVYTWNQEPTKEQGGVKPLYPGRLPGFTGHPRFRPDGTHLDVINICNNMPESRAAQEHPSTSQEPLYTGHSPETMAGTVARSINAVSIMRSNRERGLTFKSYLSNDTRYAHLHEPYSEPYLGPGAYDTDYAQPGMGPLLPGTPSASAVPQRDPLRYGSSFLSPSRPSSPVFFRETIAPGSIYMDPDFKSGPTRAPAAWSADAVQRNDVADWRFASRLKDIKREVSPQRLAAQAGVPQSDACSRSVEVGKQASERNPSVSAFKTRELRLLPLPSGRVNDVRTQRTEDHLSDNAHLGPGSYAPFTSIGRAKRRTYRIFVEPAAAAAARSDSTSPRRRQGGKAGTSRHGVSAPSYSTGLAWSGSNASVTYSQGHIARAGGLTAPASASFTGTFRSHKHGPHSWQTDSRLAGRR